LSWKQATLTTLEATARWLLPATCPLCSRRRDPGHPLCGTCLEALPRHAGSCCPRCDLPYPGDAQPHLCEACTRFPPPFTAVCSLGPYAGLLKEAIGRLKYNRLPVLDRPLGQLLAGAIGNAWPGYVPDLILPVPLHPRRLRERSFNQSLLLAREIARRLQAPLAVHALKRIRHTPPQQGLKADERMKNLRHALQLDRPLKGRSVLLVDDVMTTAATARACSERLLEGGAGEIRVATLARAARHLPV